jgi:hypothetical protein
MNTLQKLQYNNLLYTMTNKYSVKEVTTDRQSKNRTRSFVTKDNEKFSIYESGYVRKHSKHPWLNQEVVYQINPTEKYSQSRIYFKDNEFKKVTHEYTHRIKIYSELGRLTFLFNFLVKNKYITKQTNQLDATIKV